MKERPILIVLFFLLACYSGHDGYSQIIYQPNHGDPLYEPWRWTTYEQIPGREILCMTETEPGFFVFGVKNGIITYDGYQWKEQNKKNGFIDNEVNQLLYSNDKHLYAGTDSGLYKLSDQKWIKIFPIDISDKGFQKINSLKNLNTQGIVASFEKGVLIYKNKTLTLVVSQKTYYDIAPIANVSCLIVPEEKCYNEDFQASEVFQDKQDRFWTWSSYESGKGLLFYFKLANNDREIQFSKTFTEKDGLIAGNNIKFEQDYDGNIWAINSSYHTGLSIYNGAKWEYVKFNGDNTFLSIANINGEMWIGGFGAVFLCKNNKWLTYKRPVTAIPSSKIFVYKDSNGYLWIGGIQGELVRIDYSDKKWGSLKGLNFHCEDAQNNLWFISADGKVVVKKQNTWYSYDTSDGLPDSPVKIINTRSGLTVVAGSFETQACVSFFNGNKWDRQIFPELSWGVDYRVVFEDKDENLWLGCSVNIHEEAGQKGGVIKILNPGTIDQINTHYLPEDGTHMYCSYGIAQSEDGEIWLGGEHLSRFQNDKWSVYNEIDEFNYYINCVTGLPHGDVWVGSRSYGIFTCINKTWAHYDVTSGLKSNTIISILPVSANDVWVATENDICRFDGSSWTTGVFDHRLNLSREGGDIQSQKNGTVWINHSTRSWKRRALYGNNFEKDDLDNYVTVFYKADTSKPNTHIITYSDEVSSKGITFIEWNGYDKWKDTPPSKLQYSYRLNDEKWSDFKYKNNITLFNLKNGKYVFQVRARDLDFNIETNPATVSFRVLPPVYKQTWFVVLILLFICVIALYQIKAIKREKKLEKLNIDLVKHGKEIELKNYILEEQKEQILQQNLEEKDAAQSKIRFFTNISHEFRTPLTAIIGIIDNLSDNYFDNPVRFSQQLAIIKKNCRQLHQLINQVMDFRKFDKELHKLNVSEIDIVNFVTDICFTFKEFAKKYNITLTFISAYENLKGWFDIEKVERIMNNLISNAIKFTNDGGKITVKLDKKVIDGVQFVEIEVEDNGKGIPYNEIKQILDPYYLGNSSSEENLYGSGIGLSVVHDSIKIHHCDIRVSSTINQLLQSQQGYSTRFTLVLPLEISTYNESEINVNQAFSNSESDILVGLLHDNINEVKPELLDRRSLPHILIIEDNLDLRWYMVDSLKKHFHMLEAKNGKEGIKLALSAFPDLIISDIMMPEMSGIELCHIIKNDLRTSHIPVILLSALNSNESKIEGFQIGADDYITKPFSLSLLIARINNILAIHEKLKKKFKNEEPLNPEEVKFLSMDAVFMNKVKTIVEKNYRNAEFSVKILSDQFGISSRHLLSKLKTLINQSPAEYIKVYRLKKAAQLLAANKASISEIAYETGFNDLSYFGKCFTKYYGMSPSDYLKTYHKQTEIIN
ncbi:MAG: response regulator [Bacteroidales bacterium]